MLLVICGILGLILSILVPLPYLANTSVAHRVGFVLLVTSPLALLCGIEGCYRNSWLLGVSLLCHGCVGGYTGLVYFTAFGPHPLNKYVTSFLIWLQKKPDKWVFFSRKISRLVGISVIEEGYSAGVWLHFRESILWWPVPMRYDDWWKIVNNLMRKK